MDIRAFRLVTGEDLVAEVVEDGGATGGMWKVNNPVQLAMVPSREDPTKPTYGFVPYPAYSDEKTLEFHASKVVFVVVPAREFTQQYDRLFGAGLILPSSKLVS